MGIMGLESMKGSNLMCVGSCKPASERKTMQLRRKFFCSFNSTLCSHARRSSCFAAWEDKHSYLSLQAVEHLKQKGYGRVSLEQVKELREGLGIFNAKDRLSHDDEALTRISRVAPSEGSYINYLREKGFGRMSLEDVKEQQARLGIFSSDVTVHDDRASACSLKGEQGLHRNKALVEKDTVEGGYASTHGDGGKLVSVEQIGLMLTKRGQPMSHVEHGIFASWIDRLKTSTGSKSKGVVTNYSMKSRSSIQGRPVWILDACFAINLLQEPQTDDEKIACEACVKAFQHMQAQGAELVMPEVCVAEASYMLEKQAVGNRLLEVIIGRVFKIVSMEYADWKRVQELLDIYGPRHHVGVADCCLTALAESLKVVNVATTDYRHLQRLIKPKHCEIFNILP